MASLQRCLVVLVVLVLAFSAPTLWVLQHKAALHYMHLGAHVQQGQARHLPSPNAAGGRPADQAWQQSSANSTSSRQSLLVEVPLADMRSSREQLLAHLGSEEFRQRQALVLANGGRGILVSAGGRSVLTGLVVLLKVLREHLHCTLPVQVAWHGSLEMDSATLAALHAHFGPVTGFDVTQVPYPAHHRQVRLERWVGKVFALLHCSFREVLLLDADNLPLENPEPLFERRRYRQHGNLFWPDLWEGWVAEGAWTLLGLNATAAKAALQPGKGSSRRDAESGQLLIDRGRHLDALEAAFWINSWSDRLYHKHLHGDKDTFALGFALVGKAQEYMQVSLPPGGAFRWGAGQLEVKPSSTTNSTTAAKDGWQLVGCFQYDDTLDEDGNGGSTGDEGSDSSTLGSGSKTSSSSQAGSSSSSSSTLGSSRTMLGSSKGSRSSTHESSSKYGSSMGSASRAGAAVPMFFHRTMNKMQLGTAPWPLELVTGPIPDRWARYYIAHNSQGPTKGIGWQHVAPIDALQPLQLNPEPHLALPTPTGWAQTSAAITATVSATTAATAGTAAIAVGATVAAAKGAPASAGEVVRGCPLVRLSEYVQFRQLGLPIDHNASLEAACGGVRVLQLAQQAEALGERHLEGRVVDTLGMQRGSSGGNQKGSMPHGGVLVDGDLLVDRGGVGDGGLRLVPDGTPLAALRVDGEAAAASGALRAVGASVAALAWLEAHVKEFPVIEKGP